MPVRVFPPHLLSDKSLGMHRHVDGHEGKEFFQRISPGQPSWVQTARITGRRGERPFVLCQN